MKNTTVQVVGGLGNQLFGYFAGLFVSKHYGTDLILDCSIAGKNHHARSSLLDFKLDGEVTYRNGARIANYILSRTPDLGINFSRTLGSWFSYHYIRQNGFDSSILDSKPGGKLVGYFQTYKYYSSCLENQQAGPLELVNPTNWYLKMRTEAILERPIVVHVRRGDYGLKKNSAIGVLAKRYYLDSLEILRNKLGNSGNEVWIFSDEVNDVRSEFGIDGKGFRFVSPPKETPAAESLKLMSLGVGNVISNSTFSFWGATFGGHSNVVAPSDWFKFMEDPLDLIPPTWERSNSFWVH